MIGRALVTGAGGFVGVHLCRALAAAGSEVHAVLRPGGRTWRLPALPSTAARHEVDLTSFDAVRALFARVRPEVVFHAAIHHAYAAADPVRAVVADNVVAVANLLDAGTEVGMRRLVHLGSSLEYGPADRPHREDDAPRPTALHGASKAAATLIALQGGASTGSSVVVLRLFSVYGPWEPLHRLVPRAIRAALTDEALPLTPPGLRRDFVFVEDVAAACLEAAVAPGVDGEVINVGSGRQTSNEELAAEVERVVGHPLRVEVGAYPAHATDRGFWVADVGKARRLLGWAPRHDLADGLAATVEWVRSSSEPVARV